jgi:hypothetical protein
MFRSRAVVAAVFAFSLVLSPAAHAGDVKLLKQPQAFPLVISQPGSYRLKSNITVADANTTAISITVDNVTLDLNGYSIIGPTLCSGGLPVTSCSPSGTGNGIDGSANGDITVINGTVRGMGRSGVFLGPRARVKEVRVVSNGFFGIQTGFASTIANNTATSNGDAGIVSADTSTLTGNVSAGNGTDGIIAAGGSILTGNTAQRNGSNGLNADNGSTVIGNTAADNGGFGLNATGAAAYTNNAFRLNSFGSVAVSGIDLLSLA